MGSETRKKSIEKTFINKQKGKLLQGNKSNDRVADINGHKVKENVNSIFHNTSKSTHTSEKSRRRDLFNMFKPLSKVMEKPIQLRNQIKTKSYTNHGIEVWREEDDEITSFIDDGQRVVVEKTNNFPPFSPFEKFVVSRKKQRNHFDEDRDCCPEGNIDYVHIKDEQNSAKKNPMKKTYVLEFSKDDEEEIIDLIHSSISDVDNLTNKFETSSKKLNHVLDWSVEDTISMLWKWS